MPTAESEPTEPSSLLWTGPESEFEPSAADEDDPQAPHARRVLIVEDELPIRVMLADLLYDAGYGVLQASDGLEALQVLRDDRPDLIVLDVMLPRMTGSSLSDHG